MKVWTANKLTDITFQNKQLLAQQICDNYISESDFRVAIVGGGPKGVYAIERLASVWNTNNPGKDLDIVCFNKSNDFASGPNYQTEQPDFLLMNYNVGKVDFWTDELAQLVDDRPNLLDFIEIFKNDSEAKVSPTDYSSRAVTGIYLQYCLSMVIEALPSNIHLHLIVDEVRSINEGSENIFVNSIGGKRYSFSEVLCCTGHSYSFGERKKSSTSLVKSGEISPTLFQSVYPVKNLQERNIAGKTVAIKGMGLTFVDAVLAITEGKGGRFERENGRVTYMASGKEPQEIIAFCRTGLPMITRQEDLSNTGFSLIFFTPELVAHLIEKHKKLDFTLHLLPFIQREFRYQYVVHLLHYISNKYIEPDKTLRELELYASGVFPEFEPFDLEKFLSPELLSNDVHSAVIDYLEGTVFPDRFDELHQAKIAMSALWREISPLFTKLYSFGKLGGESQRDFDQNYFNRFQRVAYGPPKENMEKIIALAEAGILRFDFASNPDLTIQHQSSEVKISHEQVSQSKVATVLIDARIPKSRGPATQPQYIKNLILEMDADFFTNEDYQTGCLEIDRIGRLKKQKRISFYGTPTEGWTLDNESLSRSNNNSLSPWVKQIIKNYVNTNNPEINSDYSSLDKEADRESRHGEWLD